MSKITLPTLLGLFTTLNDKRGTISIYSSKTLLKTIVKCLHREFSTQCYVNSDVLLKSIIIIDV